MLLRIFQGSKPIAASTTPTRIDSRISRNATASGEPPRKRYRLSLAAGNSRVSLGIDRLPQADLPAHFSQYRADGEPVCRRQCPPAVAFHFDALSSREPVSTPHQVRGRLSLENAAASFVASAFSIRSSVSSRSASRGGLSQRSRLMRGNRIATPDLCRGERARPSKANSSTSP